MTDSPPQTLVDGVALLARKVQPVADVSDQVARQTDLHFWYDGGGAPILVGAHCYLRCSFPARISGWVILSDVTGSIAFTVKACTYSAFPGSLASITAAAPPAMTSARSAAGSVAQVATWADVIARDTVFEGIVASTSGTIQVCTMSIRAKRLDL